MGKIFYIMGKSASGKDKMEELYDMVQIGTPVVMFY